MAIAGLNGMEYFIFIALVIIFLLVGVTIAIVIYNRVRWQFKVIILENLSGHGYQISRNDRARLVSFGDSGEEIFYLKKIKKYRIGYGKRIANKQIAWAIGEDGYWYNWTFGDLNKKLLEMGVLPVDRDLRFATASLRKGIESRYGDKNWMEKYGALLTMGMFIFALIIFGIVMYMSFDKQKEVAMANAESIKASKEVMEIASKVLSNVDNIKSGGSGLVPAVT